MDDLNVDLRALLRDPEASPSPVAPARQRTAKANRWATAARILEIKGVTRNQHSFSLFRSRVDLRQNLWKNRGRETIKARLRTEKESQRDANKTARIYARRPGMEEAARGKSVKLHNFHTYLHTVRSTVTGGDEGFH